MGFTFRDGTYQRRVYFGKRTIKKGECAMIWRLNGSCRKIEGPQLVRLWFSTIRFCTQYIANERQFLIVNFKDGHTEYIPGPTTMYQDHLLHKEIVVKNALNVHNGEAVVVVLNKNDTKEKSGSNQLVETIKQGPLLFFPTTNQTLKIFKFDDREAQAGKRRNSWNAATRKVASDMYKRKEVIISLSEHNDLVERAYTSNDNYKLMLKLLLTWKVTDVAKLTNSAQNPLQILTNTLINDLTKYVQLKNYEDLLNTTNVFNVTSPSSVIKQNNTNKVSNNIYTSLVQKARSIGVEICNISFQGTTIDLEFREKCETVKRDKQKKINQREKENEKERREDFKLNTALARADKRTKKEFADMKHRQKLMDEAHKAKLKRNQETFDQELQQQKNKLLMKAEFYKTLQAANVDLTKYLVAKVTNINMRNDDDDTNNMTKKNDKKQLERTTKNENDNEEEEGFVSSFSNF